ncbi:MAG: cell division protein FtsA [Candidatus Atribacteria bacterium]|nr:cell division protein FtsA [Candidatus Atribacteria bacterium]MBE3127020.1 cell division protein FtsA [Candidatus Atribacteria bacterium]
MGMDEIIVGLDIGSGKVCTVVGELGEDDQIEIIGIGTSPSLGIKKGIIIDLEQAIQSAKESIESAERMAGTRINSAFVSIGGNHITSINSKGVIAISGESPEITESDIEKVIEAAKAGIVSSEKELIHILSREFIVDGQSGISDPLGMSGARLECKVHIVTGSITAVQNLIKCVEGAGLDIEEIIFGTLASSNAVLNNAEKDLGVLLIDIGAGTTEIAIFIEGGLAYSAVLPVGGIQITNDLAVGLRTSIEEAEKIKINYGSAVKNNVSPEKLVEIPSINGKDNYNVSQKYLVEIIEPRVSEIFSLVGTEVRKSGCYNMIHGGIVITGGSSLLPGISEVAEQVLNLPSRLGRPHYEGELADMINDPSYSEAIGLLSFATEKESIRRSFQSTKRKTKVKNIFTKIISWLKDFF